MRPLNELAGMHFPDEYVARMFFKEGLQDKPGRVLELGCGCGNNLLLFHAFGWQVAGVDISAEVLSEATHNIESDTMRLVQADLSQGVPIEGKFDAIMLPSVNYYLPRKGFQLVLADCAGLLNPGGLFFLRSRVIEDWRYGRGREVERNGFVLECDETGERGLLNVFYAPDELNEEIEAHLGELQGRQVLRTHYDNPQNGVIVGNEDVVIWGRSKNACKMNAKGL